MYQSCNGKLGGLENPYKCWPDWYSLLLLEDESNSGVTRHSKSSVSCLSIKDLHNQTLWSKYLTPFNPVEREEIGIITHTYTLYRYHYCSFRMTHNITYGSSYSYIGERLRYETSTMWWNNFWNWEIGWDEKHPRHAWLNLFEAMQDG